MPSRRVRQEIECSEEFDTAVHEAGHAVVGHHFGRRILWVSIADSRRERGELGRCEFEPWAWAADRNPKSVPRIRQGMAVDVAGGVAQSLQPGGIDFRVSSRICARSPYGNGVGDCFSATTKAEAVCDAMDVREFDEPLGRLVVTWRAMRGEVERAERRARKLLIGRWDAVLALARSLCRRKSRRLTGAEVLRIIG